MRIILQRVSSASVEVDGDITGSINKGLLVFIGVGENDSEKECERLAEKIVNLRIFSDENDKINLSLKDVEGAILVVSQFTLYADCRKGNRPNFTQAGKPEVAERLYNYIIKLFKEKNIFTQSGVFGANMQVSLVNDGPFTVLLE